MLTCATRRQFSHPWHNRRDRLAFSKSLLRRFLRECLDRDSSLASPWTVKTTIAERYDVPTEMPDDIKEGMQKARQGEIDKRKRMWEEKELQAEKEGRPTKKMKKAREREQKGTSSVKFVLPRAVIDLNPTQSTSC